MLIDERGNVIAHIENEPDGDETGDAVKIDLQEIANDISVEEFHCDLDGLVPNSVLNSMTRAKSRQKRRDNQMTKDYDVAFSALRVWASFVICCWTL